VLLVILLLSGYILSRKKPLENITQSENISQPKANAPPYETRGAMGDDGKEWIEFPTGSGNRFYREPSSGQWVKNK
jgi:hypothetical protein